MTCALCPVTFHHAGKPRPKGAQIASKWTTAITVRFTQGTLQVWLEPFTELRIPKIFNLRTDPYERADITSNTYYDWMMDRAWVLPNGIYMQGAQHECMLPNVGSNAVCVPRSARGS